MKAIFEVVKHNMLFDGIAYSDFCAMCECLESKVQTFENNHILYLAGDVIDAIGIVITGRVQITKEGRDGTVIMLSEVLPSGLFAETFACAGVAQSPVTVTTSEASTVLFLNFRKVIATCRGGCAFHQQLIQNMMRTIAMKNLFLNQKIDILSKKTIREKLLCFFDFERKGCNTFTLPYNREELAAYIACDRSAMCAELSRMQRDGIIKYNKNKIELL